jgi:hypothetical protein
MHLVFAIDSKWLSAEGPRVLEVVSTGRQQMPIKRQYQLITIKGVRALMSGSSKFLCRYDLVELIDGKPRYQCIYIVNGKESILISDRVSENGVEPRLFNFWPGLFKHHFEFGDEADLTIGRDFIITTGERRGRNDVPSRRKR